MLINIIHYLRFRFMYDWKLVWKEVQFSLAICAVALAGTIISTVVFSLTDDLADAQDARSAAETAHAALVSDVV